MDSEARFATPVSGDFIGASRNFKASATSAVIRLRKKSRFREPWQLWLDLLRGHLESHGLGDRRSALDGDSDTTGRDNFGEPGRYSDCGPAIYVSVREWSLMHESGESLYLVRKRIGYTTDDESASDGLHLRHQDGRLALDGIIACVPRASADFARYLESAESSSKATERQTFMKPHIAPARKRTLNAVADNSGVRQSSLSRWYRGEVRLSEVNIVRLADYLKVDRKLIPN